MTEHKADPPAGGMIILLLVLFNAILLKEGFVNKDNSWLSLLISFALLLIAIFARWKNRESR
jgi:hypothetical protein